jgi:hypothetical protein
MDAGFYQQELYPLQDRVLGAFAATDTGFRLPGLSTGALRVDVEKAEADHGAELLDTHLVELCRPNRILCGSPPQRMLSTRR